VALNDGFIRYSVYGRDADGAENQDSFNTLNIYGFPGGVFQDSRNALLQLFWMLSEIQQKLNERNLVYANATQAVNVQGEGSTFWPDVVIGAVVTLSTVSSNVGRSAKGERLYGAGEIAFVQAPIVAGIHGAPQKICFSKQVLYADLIPGKGLYYKLAPGVVAQIYAVTVETEAQRQRRQPGFNYDGGLNFTAFPSGTPFSP